MAITKIPEFSFKHVDQPDRPTATAAEIKANFDSRAKNIRDTFNNLNVTELTEGAYNYAASTTGTDAYAITLTYFAAYTTGATVKFKADVANTGACTLNVNGLGAKAIKLDDGNNPTDGVIKAGAIVTAVYDGTNFQIVTGGVAAHADATTAHGATSAATVNRIVIRDAAGRAQVAAPSAAADIARKDTVDAVQTNLNTHLADNTTHVEEFRINGETDETAQLQRAFDYVKAQVLLGLRVGLIFTNGKIYNISAPLDFTYHHRCTISGSAVIRVADSVVVPLAYMIDMRETATNLYHTGHFTMRNIRFNANNKALKIIEAIGTNGYGLYYADITRCFFEGIMLGGFGIYGVSWTTKIQKCNFQGYGTSSTNVGEFSGTGVYVGNSSNGLVITKNNFTRLNRGILRDSGNYGKTAITRNTFDAVRNAAIKMEGNENHTIHDNYFESVGSEAESVFVYLNTEITGVKACIILISSRVEWQQQPFNCSIKRNEFSQCGADDLIVFDGGYGLEVKENTITHKTTPHNSLVKILKHGFGYFGRTGSYGAIIKNNKVIDYTVASPSGIVLVSKILDTSMVQVANVVDFILGSTLSKVVISDVAYIDPTNRKRKLPPSLYTRNFITDVSYSDFFTITKEVISGENVYNFLRTASSSLLGYIAIDPQFFERLKGTYVRFSFEVANTQNGAGIRFAVSDGVKTLTYLPNGNQINKTLINAYVPMDFIFYVDPLATTLKFQPSSYCSAGNSIFIKNFDIVPSGYDLSTYNEMV